MPKLLKPARLNPGDTIGLIAPASPPPDPKALDAAVAGLEARGFRVKLAPNLRKRVGFLAGTDRERAGDLLRMFTDRKVNAIMCLRGGYGTGRLLSRLDYSVIRQRPKVFIGYSDITALHCALVTKAGIVSFHGPMAASSFGKPDVPQFTPDGLFRTVMRPEAAGSICHGLKGSSNRVKALRRGTATGPLLGGNLSLLCTTLGTPFQPEFKGRILFLEDIDEAPYRIDRLLTHLLNAGVLQQVAGVAIGVNVNCMDKARNAKTEYRQTIDDVLKERLSSLGVPVVTGLPFGHVQEIATLPLGVRAELDAKKGDLVVLEAAVE